MKNFLTRRRMLAAGAGAGAAVAAPALLGAGRAQAGAEAPANTGPVAVERLPRRIYDSRRPDSIMGGARLMSGESVEIIAGSAEGFPFSYGAFLNCTITDTIGSGWVTVFAADGSGLDPIPQTSNVNWSMPGQTLANLVLAPIGSEHSVVVKCLGSGATHFILDVQGYVPILNP